jgi:hypothetical protein
MNITHPFADADKTLVLPDQVKAYVAKLPELPTVQMDKPYLKAYWAKKLGLVPAGTYTDPTTREAEKAVEGLYHCLKGTKITRHRVAVALNLVSADQVDDIRERLMERNAKIYRGAPGVSVHSTRYVKDVIADQAAKQA